MRLPFDKVKIDGRWISGATQDPRRADMANAVVHLAKRLSLTVVAAGIEHSQQADALASEGCDLGQGYHFGRPDTFDEIERRYTVWHEQTHDGAPADSDGLSNIH